MGAIYLIRHGQASFASSNYDNLSNLGIEQARILGEALLLRKVQPNVVVCGGMQRHRQTAEHCLGGMNREPSWDEDSGWNEYDHQRMLEAFDPRYAHETELAAELVRGGDPRRSFQELFSQAAARWVGGEAEHDYEESFGEFCARIEGALSRLHARLGKAQTALVFTSGGAISAVCKRLLGLANERVMPLSYVLANASVTKVIYGSSGLRLSTLNEHGHFEGRDPKLLTYR
jgi:broad specificity phosphatase PhoE